MHRSRRAAVLVAASAATCLGAFGAQAAVASGLVPHRAVYDLRLKEA